jgi:hypothetical protein
VKCYICQNDFRLKELIEVEVEHLPADEKKVSESRQAASGKSKTKEMICQRCAEEVRKEQNQ